MPSLEIVILRKDATVLQINSFYGFVQLWRPWETEEGTVEGTLAVNGAAQAVSKGAPVLSYMCKQYIEA